ncbi:hypothetical protein [Phytomonospora endophytica]|uniref:Uncharacterized protein n=1 Tax=Phytomonospora endophytica TaxID=714109 RepID=A0A841FQ77_9ACTN|nr:hypothetical protein [Phytomonospora endophytica]MBB6039451.1 hypothetical protein [Phytomonospora endophytica]GIG70178.1 hypothetical protein Pen01_64730 [Phytomonospora endophytica]
MAVYRHKPGLDREPGTSPYARGFGARRFWGGCGVTASAAAVIAVAGFVVVRSVFEMPILGVSVYSGVTEPSVVVYALVVVAGAGAAALLMYMLVTGSARPFAYFRWIMGLALVLVALLPVFAGDDHPTGLVTAALNVFIGGAVWLGVVVAARLALRT